MEVDVHATARLVFAYLEKQLDSGSVANPRERGLPFIPQASYIQEDPNSPPCSKAFFVEC